MLLFDYLHVLIVGSFECVHVRMYFTYVCMCVRVYTYGLLICCTLIIHRAHVFRQSLLKCCEVKSSLCLE